MANGSLSVYGVISQAENVEVEKSKPTQATFRSRIPQWRCEMLCEAAKPVLVPNVLWPNLLSKRCQFSLSFLLISHVLGHQRTQA